MFLFTVWHSHLCNTEKTNLQCCQHCKLYIDTHKSVTFKCQCRSGLEDCFQVQSRPQLRPDGTHREGCKRSNTLALIHVQRASTQASKQLKHGSASKSKLHCGNAKPTLCTDEVAPLLHTWV